MARAAKPIYDYSDQQRFEFSQLIKDKRGIILSVIRKFTYIKQDDEDDYFQEVLLYAWHRFHHFNPAITTFNTWLYKTAEWGVLHYTRYLMKIQGPERSLDNISEWYVSPDEAYNEEHIEALKLAISYLPEDLKFVVEMFLEGHSFKKRSIEDGIHEDTYKRIFAKARRFILSNRGRFFENISVDPGKFVSKPTGLTNELSPCALPVEMRDLNGGFVKTWPSIAEAGRNGYSPECVRRCMAGKGKSHRGYLWCRPGSFDNSIIARYKQKKHPIGRAIEQVSLDGFVINQYSSATAAGRLPGLSETCIRRVLDKEQPTYKNCVWRYSTVGHEQKVA